jgi:hypothetical protein
LSAEQLDQRTDQDVVRLADHIKRAVLVDDDERWEG